MLISVSSVVKVDSSPQTPIIWHTLGYATVQALMNPCHLVVLLLARRRKAVELIDGLKDLI